MLWSVLGWLVVALVVFRGLRAIAHVVLLRLGVCRYHSPLLYTTGLGPRREIHLGTTRDFLAQGPSPRRQRLARLAEGLLALCDDVESGRLRPDVRLSGTTDLLRAETASRLGFLAGPPRGLAGFCALTAWAQVSLLRSLLERGPAPVRVGRLRRLEAAAGELLARRHAIEHLRNRLAASRPDRGREELEAAQGPQPGQEQRAGLPGRQQRGRVGADPRRQGHDGRPARDRERRSRWRDSRIIR
jgi:hypothetical protein